MSKPEIILIGGGGHARSCIDVIEQEGKYQIAGIVDEKITSDHVFNYSILGSDADLEKLRFRYNCALVAVGQIKTSDIRARLFNHLRQLDFQIPVIVSPYAYVSRHAQIDMGTIVMHNALINANSKIGKNCIINSKVLLEHDSVIEDHCHISTAAVINGGSKIKEGSFVGSNATVIEYVSSRPNDFIKAGSVFKGYNNE